MGASDELLLKLTGQDDGATAVLNQGASAVDGLTASEKNATQQNESFAGSFTEINSAVSLAEQGIQKLKEAYDFAKEGASIKRIGEQWQNTATQFGVNADSMIKSLDRAAQGTVDDEELMQAASKAFTQGIVTSGDQLTKTMEFARAAAVRFGGSTIENFDKIIQSANMLSTRGFKPLGVVLPSIEVLVKEYAKAHGVAASSIDDETKKSILLNAALAKTGDLVKSVGSGVMDEATKFERFDAKVKELGDQLHVMAADALNPLVTNLTENKVMLDENASATDRLAAAQDILANGFGKYQQDAAMLVPYLQGVVDYEKQLTDTGLKLDEGMHDNGLAFRDVSDATRNLSSNTVTLDEQTKNITESNKLYQQSLADITKSAQEDAIAHGDLAAKLLDAKPAEIAKAALAGLKTEFQQGLITQGQYEGLVESTQIKFGLASRASYAMQEGVDLLNQKFADGIINAQQYQDGLAKLPQAAADGVVTLADVGIKVISDHQSKLDRLNELGNQTELTAQQSATKKIQDSAAVANASIDDIVSHWQRVPANVTTTYHIVTVGDVPLGPSNNMAGGGVIGYAGGNGKVLTGEFGPEPVSLPVGAQVHSTSQYNQYNDWHISTDEMGMAYLLEAHKQDLYNQFNSRMS